MKNFIMKLLGIETASEKLARLEFNQTKHKETIDLMSNGLKRLTEIHAEMADCPHKLQTANCIAYFSARLETHRKQYTENQLLINLIRTTIEAEKGLHA